MLLPFLRLVVWCGIITTGSWAAYLLFKQWRESRARVLFKRFVSESIHKIKG